MSNSHGCARCYCSVSSSFSVATCSPKTHSISSSTLLGIDVSSFISSGIDSFPKTSFSVFVQLLQVQLSLHAFSFALHPHYQVWHPVLQPHPLGKSATHSFTASMLLSLFHSTESTIYNLPSIISKGIHVSKHFLRFNSGRN